jgi:integrase
MTRPPYTNEFTDATGKRRIVFRKTGHKRRTLPGLPGDLAFEEAYAAALNEKPTKPKHGGEGSFDQLIHNYLGSKAFDNKAPDTKRIHRHVLLPLASQYGNNPIKTVTVDQLKRALNAVTTNEWKRRSLYYTLRVLFDFAVEHSFRPDNPMRMIKAPPRPPIKGHRAWTDEEIAQFRAHWSYGTEARLQFELAFGLAARRVNVAKLGPQHIKNGRVEFEHAKKGDWVSIPLSQDLRLAINARPYKTGLTFLAPANLNEMSERFKRWCAAAGLPPDCRMHGLRAARCRVIAEANGSARMIMAVSGHKTLSEVQHYTNHVDRRRLADEAAALEHEAARRRNLKVAAD